MKVTFLIGNGFDINLGLATRYTDFYDYYIKKEPNDMIAKAIQDGGYQLWSDLELGLGRFVGAADDNFRIEEFLDSKATLESHLIDYLIRENERFDIPYVGRTGSEFGARISDFWEEFPRNEKDHYTDIAGQQKAVFRFISFNYTDTLDRIIGDARRFYKNISDPLHIHGCLEDGMILGVDGESQMLPKEDFIFGAEEINLNDLIEKRKRLLNRASQLKRYMVKSQVNEDLGEGRNQEAEQLITDSNYVCIFGHSLGETDSMWWECIYNWLTKSKNNRLVLYMRWKKSGHLSAQEKLRCKDTYLPLFLRRCGIDPSAIPEEIRQQIIVVPNSDIFTFSRSVIQIKPKKPAMV